MDVARRKSIYEFMINAPYWRQKAWNESNGKSGWKLAGINPFNLFQFIERWAGSNILDSADKDSEVGVVIITGSGEKAFVAGADIKEFADFTISQGGELAMVGQQTLFSFIENSIVCKFN